ncbi:hypothetical protein [Jeotgalibacillus proteolyticus]|uniref:Uncharacterized protein n=1 Tax=Jeotgalibacillus proteolyticus TaxID=2082395 RepID=A0A2S5G8U7_9BACL|nr:hypothetical protein [Jeotgalibacillus proteolyticus]PPA69341.1 hypothetical protein C4B60_16215 [Jeotgalibacillus proteolyticus]
MQSVLDIVRAVLPLLIVGGIVVFVIKRLEHKYKNGTLGKKESESAQIWLDSSIPLGMLFGCSAGLVFSMFTPFSLLSGISIGAGIGYLFGYFAYEFFSREEENYS